MRDVRFYEEFKSNADKHRGHSGGNVFAAFVGNGYRSKTFGDQNVVVVDGLGSVFYQPDSPVATCAVSLRELALRFKRVSEARARRVHPTLFKCLDGDVR